MQLFLLMQQDAGGQSARGSVKHSPYCVNAESSTLYGEASTATAVEVQGNGSKALLIDVNGATKAGAEAPHSTWLKPLSAAMLTCCALAAGTQFPLEHCTSRGCPKMQILYQAWYPRRNLEPRAAERQA